MRQTSFLIISKKVSNAKVYNLVIAVNEMILPGQLHKQCPCILTWKFFNTTFTLEIASLNVTRNEFILLCYKKILMLS